MLATLSLSFTHLANASSVLRPGQQEQVAKALDGTAPVAASSGPNQRHRLNRAGNRRMNKAIHMMALTQARMDPRVRAYVARRCDEGRTRREATRALKRHLSDVIYRQLRTDAAVASVPASDTDPRGA